MSDGGVTGVDLEHVNVSSGPATVNVHYEERPLTPAERMDWRDRQIAELRYALLGDDRYGVSGLVDSVRNQRVWLIILTVLVALVMFILIWQGFQIHQMFQILEQLQ